MASTKKIRKMKKYRLKENQQARHLVDEVSKEHYLFFADSCYEYGHAWGRRVASKMMKRFRRKYGKLGLTKLIQYDTINT